MVQKDVLNIRILKEHNTELIKKEKIHHLKFKITIQSIKIAKKRLLILIGSIKT